MSILTEFPSIDTETLRSLKKSIDAGFKNFSRNYGDSIESFFEPVRFLLIESEQFLINTPWPIIMAIIAIIAWAGSKNIKIVVSVVMILLLIGYFDMWENTMKTISITFVAALLAIVFGIPIGILMAKSNFFQRVMNPVLDVMQTMPSFVYLIPVVMLLGIGKIPGLIAVVIYSIPPMIRLTNLGIRLVNQAVIEAADSYGASNTQKLIYIQIPLALPTIMAGINQTIMLALSMVVIASMIGVTGLGQPVLTAIQNQYFTLGIFNGFAIVGIAIVFDRVSQAYGKRIQESHGTINDK
ncbi:MAG: proline/glycine betaine ABC transporter permease [Pseudomonadota bacterium]|nr:proline/glycine betaine ABC transporter permease [Pseudomonadota bacterium]MEC7090478.1 proline/glycine betaine ABC transporter permease [Pseudomonadota bacterium]MEC8315709.1 proline/glycine betaine ABC transporter permease [Pseudomonadota bacterium]MEC8403709.1 proline/glycine betaine ABC transporter permease [Pseudomonadota bacterium]MEC8453357.1 proline/glycine betaine ABC transporter permease [Pseudomonadota bacterium]|tara:strand:+ start:9996 stop:10886 length:891 start_codon:yes stop_codon:yes gene_type:complete